MPHPLKLAYREDIGKTPLNPPYRDVLAKVPELVQSLLKEYPDPSIHVMVFLAGEECLQETEQALWKLGIEGIEVLCIFAGMPSHMLDQLFTDPAPDVRRVYLCTNVAESSITVDVDIVVDTGYHKVLVPKSTAQVLEIERITKANARQRAGRTGRLRAGSVYRLYPESVMDTMPEHAPYEFELIPPYSHILKMYGAGLNPQVLLGFGNPPADNPNGGIELEHSVLREGSSAIAAVPSAPLALVTGLTAEQRWLQAQFHEAGAVSDEPVSRPMKRARMSDSTGVAGLTNELTPSDASRGVAPASEDGPSSWMRYERIIRRLLEMRLISAVAGAQPTVTDLGKRVSAYPVSIPHGAMLVQLANEHSAQMVNDTTLLAMCMFVAILETGTPSKLLWLPPEARKDAQVAKDYAAKHFSSWYRRDDLEAFVALLMSMYSEAKRTPDAPGKPGRADHSGWCRDHSVNDRVMRAVTGTLRQLVFQSFYCEQRAIDSVIDRVVKQSKVNAPDFDACRRTLWATFPEQVMSDAHAKGEPPTWKVTYTLGRIAPGQSRNDETKRWIVDTKRTLNTSYDVASSELLPKEMLSMCMFKARGKTGHLVQLASCIVLPALLPADSKSATTAAVSATVGTPAAQIKPKPARKASILPNVVTSIAITATTHKFVEELQAQQRTLLAQAQRTADKAKRKKILNTIEALTASIAKHLGK
jgi:hypothetical protein